MSDHILSLIGLLALYLGLTLIVTLIAAEFHERSHWLVARVWTRAVSIDRWRGFFPNSVNFQKPYDLPTNGIRLAGLAPTLFGFSVGTTIFTLLNAPFSFRLLFAAPFWISMVLSPSDLLATLSPRRFQEYAINNEQAGHIKMSKILLEELR